MRLQVSGIGTKPISVQDREKRNRVPARHAGWNRQGRDHKRQVRSTYPSTSMGPRGQEAIDHRVVGRIQPQPRSVLNGVRLGPRPGQDGHHPVRQMFVLALNFHQSIWVHKGERVKS